MGVAFRGKSLTLENYKTVLGQYVNLSPDILDEVRSAILDDTQIGNYIIPCQSDSYQLGQIRMYLREMYPVQYISTYMTGRTIFLLREIQRRGIDAEALLKYVCDGCLFVSAQTFETLTEFVLLGTDISKVNFHDMEETVVPSMLTGLQMGYPMWLLAECKKLTPRKVAAYKRGMQLGFDIHPFIDGDWSVDVLICIFSSISERQLGSLLCCITAKTELEVVEVYVKALKDGIDIEKLALTDRHGYSVYNQYQLEALVDAEKAGVLCDKLRNPYLSDMQMRELTKELVENATK